MEVQSIMDNESLSSLIVRLKELSDNPALDLDTKILLYNMGTENRILKSEDNSSIYVIQLGSSNYILLNKDLEPLLVGIGILDFARESMYRNRGPVKNEEPKLLEVYVHPMNTLSDEAKAAIKYKSLINVRDDLALLDQDTADLITRIGCGFEYTLEKISNNSDYFIEILGDYYEEWYDDGAGNETYDYYYDDSALEDFGIPRITWYNFNQHKVIQSYSERFEYGSDIWCKLANSETQWQRFTDTNTGFISLDIKQLPKKLNHNNFQHYKEYLR